MPEETRLTATQIRTIGTTLVKTKSGSEASDWTVGSVESIGEISREVEEIDITTLDSPNGVKEYISGGSSNSDLTISGKIKETADKQTPTKMLALLENGNVETWTITYPNGATLAFSAFVKSFTFGEASVDKTMGYSVTLKISGTPTYTAS